jgi:hypothetical protein
MNTEDYGLDEAALDAANAVGDAALTQKLAEVKERRVGLLDAAEAALKKGKPIPLVVVDSPQNLHQNRHFRSMHNLYCVAWNGVTWENPNGGTLLPGGALTLLTALKINGNNTYAKARTRYRDLLVESLAKTPVDKRPKIGVTTLADPVTRKRKASAEGQPELPLHEGGPVPADLQAALDNNAIVVADDITGELIDPATLEPVNPPEGDLAADVAKGGNPIADDDAHYVSKGDMAALDNATVKAPEPEGVIPATDGWSVAYSSKSNATKAAWKQLGRDTTPGLDFLVQKAVSGGFVWRGK